MVIELTDEYPQAFLDLTVKVAAVEVAVVYFIVTEDEVQLPTMVAPPVMIHLQDVAPMTVPTEYTTAVWLLQTDTDPVILPGMAGAAETESVR